MTKVHEIMSRSVLTLQPDQTIEEAARMLADFNVSGAPVCNSAGHVVGIFSKTNLADHIGEGALTPQAHVQQFMSQTVTVASEDDDLLDAVRVMAEQQIRRLPVVNAAGDLVGILSATDLLRSIANGRLPVAW